MTLTEILMGLELNILRSLVQSYAMRAHGYVRPYDSNREPKQGFEDFHEVFVRGPNRDNKEFLVNCLVQRQDTLNNTQAELILRKLNRSSIPLRSHQHNKAALVVSFLPKKEVEQALVDIAIEAEVPLSDYSKQCENVAELAAILSMDNVYNSAGFSLYCGICRKNNPSEANHCIYCGKELGSPNCMKCKSENPPQAKFCMECGERL